MTTDAFKLVNFNAGEHAVYSDFNLLQRQMIMQLMEMFTLPQISNMQDPTLVQPCVDPEHSMYSMGFAAGAYVPLDVCFAPFPSGAVLATTGSAREVTIRTPGPLVQVKRAFNSQNAFDPNDPALLAYWCKENEFTLTTAVGDATNPRIDIIEMRLNLVTTSSETRVYGQEYGYATLDLGPLTTNCETVLRAASTPC